MVFKIFRIKMNYLNETFEIIFLSKGIYLAFKYYFLNFLTFGIVPTYIFNKFSLTNIDKKAK